MAKAFTVEIKLMIKYAFWGNWISWGNFYDFSRKNGAKRDLSLIKTMIKYAQY
jgi:hypothetical protein